VTEELTLWDPPSLGRYRLLARLGSGGMGVVYLARSPGGRSVAVKSIRPDLVAHPEFRMRFRTEVSAASNVNGLYTAVVVDADTDGPVPWLATAYVEGPSLAAAVKAYGPLPVRSVLLLAAALAEGLQAIHAAGIAHRDLKPSNVLLAADGPRVIDFGISWALEDDYPSQPGRAFGTPAFMSPEQAAGTMAGSQSDMFSLGLVLVFAATGETTIGSCPDLSRVPEEIRPIIVACLAKDPHRRPRADQLLAQLGTRDLDTDWRSVVARLSGSVRARRAMRYAAVVDSDTEFATGSFEYGEDGGGYIGSVGDR
jgi:serine/threonine protein kinase